MTRDDVRFANSAREAIAAFQTAAAAWPTALTSADDATPDHRRDTARTRTAATRRSPPATPGQPLMLGRVAARSNSLREVLAEAGSRQRVVLTEAPDEDPPGGRQARRWRDRTIWHGAWWCSVRAAATPTR
jgi:hypothetical protein